MTKYPRLFVMFRNRKATLMILLFLIHSHLLIQLDQRPKAQLMVFHTQVSFVHCTCSIIYSFAYLHDV